MRLGSVICVEFDLVSAVSRADGVQLSLFPR
jgi:hypothetical protein